MSSLFDELTDNDMLVKGPSTAPKKVKKGIDPLAAYGGASIPASSAPKRNGKVAISGNLNIATRSQRLGTSMLDNVVTAICSYALAFAAGIALVASGNFTEEKVQTATVVVQIASWVFVLLYFVVLEAATGRTLGKMAMGTRVVSADGSDPSFGQVLGRTACRLIPFELFSFLSGNQPVGWHDSIPGTRVISTRS